MNNLSPLGLLTCFIFSMVLNGAPFGSAAEKSPSSAYITNHSRSIVYYKPESKDANPGFEPDAAYAIAPGESLFLPADAIVTSATKPGHIFRIPTGARLIVNERGIPEPSNIIARGGLWFKAYGDVQPPSHNFAKLANSKQVLYRLPDISGRQNYGYTLQ